MQISNIAGYKFIALSDLESLKNSFQEQCLNLGIKGTILLSPEGINVNLSASIAAIGQFETFLQADQRFADMQFHQSYSEVQAFRRLKVKLKKEIITFRQSAVCPTQGRAESIAPELLKQWLDEKRDITLLDTRNDFEINFGTFNDAINLHLDNFGELPDAILHLNREKPVVMFCTGGIRCEKAALHMEKQGFKKVYQLDGGILGYFAQVGNAHYIGDCFVFDERVVVSPDSFE